MFNLNLDEVQKQIPTALHEVFRRIRAEYAAITEPKKIKKYNNITDTTDDVVYPYVYDDYWSGSFVKSDFDSSDFDLNNGPWIAGGYVRSKFENNNPRDIDVYFRNIDQLRNFNMKTRHKHNNVNFNLVTFTYFPSWKHVLESIDFTVCSGITDGKHFILHKNFYEDFQNKTLQFTEKYEYITSLERVAKYIAYGYTPGPNVIPKVLYFEGKEYNSHIKNGKFDARNIES